jgi:hypothetical protein
MWFFYIILCDAINSFFGPILYSKRNPVHVKLYLKQKITKGLWLTTRVKFAPSVLCTGRYLSRFCSVVTSYPQVLTLCREMAPAARCNSQPACSPWYWSQATRALWFVLCLSPCHFALHNFPGISEWRDVQAWGSCELFDHQQHDGRTYRLIDTLDTPILL